MRKALITATLLVAVGCAKVPGTTEFSWELYKAPAASPQFFAGQTIAVLPIVPVEFDPLQEVYRETLGGMMSATLLEHAEGVRLISLSETQSMVNRAGMADALRDLYNEYEITAILRRDLLQSIGSAIGARYVIVPKVLRFEHESFDRVNLIGISFLRTRLSTLDIHVQVWDTETGAVVWQGVGEGSEAAEAVEGRPISFVTVARLACESLAARLPWLPPHQEKPKK